MSRNILMADPSRATYFLGEDKVLLDDLINGLNLDIIQISSVEDFTSYIGDSGLDKATVIMTNNIHADLRPYLQDVVSILEEYINVSSETIVIEVGLEGNKLVSPNAPNPQVFRYHTEVDVIKDRRRQVRDATVKKAQTDKEANDYLEAYQDFEREIAELKRNIDTLEFDKAQVENKLSETIRKATKHEEQYNDISVKWDNLVNEREQLDEQVKKLRDTKTHNELELENIRHRATEAENNFHDAHIDNLAYKKKVTQLHNEIESLKSEVEIKENHISELKKEYENLLHRMSQFNNYDDIVGDFQSTKREVEAMRDKYEQEQIKRRQAELALADVQERLIAIQKDEATIEQLGRSVSISKVNLNGVNVYYFKIIQEIPYLNSHIQTFIRLLSENTSQIVKTCIIRFDEGLDADYFGNIPIFKNLEQARESGAVSFRLFPSLQMFGGKEYFEDTVDTLIVLDYTRNNKYLINTDSVYRKFNVVTTTKVKNRLGLEGTTISTSEDADIRLVYSDEIATSRVKENKQGFIESEVRNWLRRVGIY